MSHRCLWSLLACLVVSVGCTRSTPPSRPELTFVSTTTTQDSGLLDVLIPAFEQESGVRVKVIAVGSGQALELARRGDADLLLTHSPEAEAKFMQDGWGETRTAVMHNDYVIAGPADDPAGVQKSPSAVDAFRAIATAQAPFVSRSDESGTHVKEKSLWKNAEITPQGDWYLQAGTGMAPSLRLAHEKHAYVLCDRGTFLSLRKELQLAIVHEGDETLLNRYSVITLNPAKFPHLRREEGERLASFLVSPAGQALISQFGVERFGQPLFVPDAIPAQQP